MAKAPGIPTDKFRMLLKANGYRKDRYNSAHEVWERTITDSVSIPIHNKEINGCMAKRLIKEHNLKEA